MIRKMIQLKDIEEVKDFVTMAATYPYEIDLIAGRYVINAKSIMGVLSLDLGEPLKLEIYTEDASGFLEAIQNFIVE